MNGMKISDQARQKIGRTINQNSDPNDRPALRWFLKHAKYWQDWFSWVESEWLIEEEGERWIAQPRLRKMYTAAYNNGRDEYRRQIGG